MDLTGVTSFIVKHALDENTGVLTITFRDITDTTTLGEVILEEVRARAFFESVLRMEEARFPNGVTRQGFKSFFDLQADEGETEFV
jgi:hypothetical protein